MKVDLYMVEGSSLQADPIGEKNCLMDWQAMTADGTQMTVQKSWVLNASAEYALVTTCEEGVHKHHRLADVSQCPPRAAFRSAMADFWFSICPWRVYLTGSADRLPCLQTQQSTQGDDGER